MTAVVTLQPVRTCAELVPAFRAATSDRDRRALCLEVQAAGAPNLASALWEEHRARDAAEAATVARRRAIREKRPIPGSRAIAAQQDAVALVHTILWGLPGSGAQTLPEGVREFDPSPADYDDPREVPGVRTAPEPVAPVPAPRESGEGDSAPRRGRRTRQYVTLPDGTEQAQTKAPRADALHYPSGWVSVLVRRTQDQDLARELAAPLIADLTRDLDRVVEEPPRVGWWTTKPGRGDGTLPKDAAVDAQGREVRRTDDPTDHAAGAGVEFLVGRLTA